jgi:hypothetical protein
VIDNLERGEWRHVDHTWDVDTLWVLRPGRWHATWVSWLPDGERLGWYVNLQRPYRRTAVGIEAMDLMLDLVVDPDRNWRWKDRAEFDECVARGLYDAGTVAAVERDAAAVIGDIAAGVDAFGDTWVRPPDIERRPCPELPADWARVP